MTRYGGRRVLRSRLLLLLLCGRLSRLSLNDVDASFEVSAVFDNDTGGLDVSNQPGVLTNLQAVAGVHVALDGSEDHDFARFHGGVHFTVWSDGEPVLLQFDTAFHIAVDIKVFFAKDLAVDFNGFP